jgi:hypothetical protein
MHWLSSSDVLTQELGGLLNDAKLQAVPLLIYCNKSDLSFCAGAREITDIMRLNDISGRRLRVAGCSALTGEGLDVRCDYSEFLVRLAIKRRRRGTAAASVASPPPSNKLVRVLQSILRQKMIE